MASLESLSHRYKSAAEQIALEQQVVESGLRLSNRMIAAVESKKFSRDSKFFGRDVLGVPQIPKNPSEPTSVPHVWSIYFKDQFGVKRVSVRRFAGKADDRSSFHSIEVLDANGAIAHIDGRGRVRGNVSPIGIREIDILFDNSINAWTGPVIPPSTDDANHKFIINQRKSYNAGKGRRT